MSNTLKGEDFRRLIGRFDPNCIRHFQGATMLCQSRTHYEISPDHLILRLLDDSSGDVHLILTSFQVDRGQVRRGAQRALEELPVGHTGRPALSPKLVELFQSAAILADEYGYDQIRTGLLLLAMALNPGHLRTPEFTTELERINADQLREHFQQIVRESAESGTSPDPGAGSAAASGGDGSALQQFTVDVTAKAAAGGIDPVFGRDHEIRQMIDIFARRRKNNPILVGEPGTGKTAVVEGLALRIVQNDVPPTLKGVKVISLDLGLLQAGAGVKGEFENRLKNVIRDIKNSQVPVITFIDEAHTLIGAGGAAGGGDAANLLKPALARGELRTVAATTWAEYKKYFEKDAALERRFQLVRCDEPSVDDATVMLRGLKERYEKHHKVVVMDDAVTAAVQLSKRYISGRFLPDKAVDLLDTASARVAVALGTKPGVLEDVDRALSYRDTAIAALRRDAAAGEVVDEGRISEMETSRASLLKDRERIEARWKAEMVAVQRVLELRGTLRAFRVDGEPTAESGLNPIAAGAEKTDETGDGSAPRSSKAFAKDAPSAADDDAAIRKEIDAAIADLHKIQGDDPMLHPHVDQRAVAAVVGDWTGIPIGRMVKDEITATLQMEERLKERVVGQDHAIRVIAEKLRTAKAGLGNPDQPMGVFMCVGPSGVGKTELALSVADLLFGGERFLTTINMSEFMEKHTVSQLKGSPPGYVGYGEGGVLTEAVRQHPYSVVLLDEVEKAHPDVMNLFYQVFDKGCLADGEGRVVNFRNTVVMMTSNLGTDAIQSLCASGEPVSGDDLKEAIYPQLREHFKPALVARMTVIPFLTLGPEVLKSIARMKVEKIAKRLAAGHGIAFDVDDAVYEQIASRCTQLDVGARNIDHILDQSVMPELSRQLLQRMTEETLPKRLRMTATREGGFSYLFEG